MQHIWRSFGLQPWRTETFKVSPDPLLIDKIRDIVGIYLNPPRNAVVFSVDEKPQIQALERTAPVLPMLPGVPERRSFDYERHGTTDLFAALNIANGKIISKLSAQHTAADFRDFLDQIDHAAEPGLGVHVICDNLSTHKAPAVRSWLLAHPRFVLHFTPTYTSWINQVDYAELAVMPSGSAAASTAACSAHSKNSPPPSRNGSSSGMTPPAPSSGPRPPTRSSTPSAATAHGSHDRLTSPAPTPTPRPASTPPPRPTTPTPTTTPTVSVSSIPGVTDDPDEITASGVSDSDSGFCTAWLDNDGSGTLSGTLNTSFFASCDAELYRSGGPAVSLSATWGAERTSALSDTGHTMWICVWASSDPASEQCSSPFGMTGDTPVQH